MSKRLNKVNHPTVDVKNTIIDLFEGVATILRYGNQTFGFKCIEGDAIFAGIIFAYSEKFTHCRSGRYQKNEVLCVCKCAYKV